MLWEEEFFLLVGWFTSSFNQESVLDKISKRCKAIAKKPDSAALYFSSRNPFATQISGWILTREHYASLCENIKYYKLKFLRRPPSSRGETPRPALKVALKCMLCSSSDSAIVVASDYVLSAKQSGERKRISVKGSSSSDTWRLQRELWTYSRVMFVAPTHKEPKTSEEFVYALKGNNERARWFSACGRRKKQSCLNSFFLAARFRNQKRLSHAEKDSVLDVDWDAANWNRK